MNTIDKAAALQNLIEFASSHGYSVRPGKTTDSVSDVFDSKMQTEFREGKIYWAWFNSVTDPTCSLAICFKPGQVKVVSYGDKYG